MSKLPLAVQLYTLRDLTAKDLPAVVREVARIGYSGVELAGFGNLKTAHEFRKAIDDAGLKIVGSHVGIERLEKDLGAVLDENDVLGNKYICVPWLPEDRRKDAAGWKRMAGVLSDLAAKCAQRGFFFAYHNHSFEFQPFDGKPGLDILWQHASPQVKAELDTFWVRHGGQDPVEYMNRVGPRVVLLHLKDMAAGPDQKFADVGSGILDFPGILAAGQKLGVAWYIVEQDDCYGGSSIESIRNSFENLRKLGAV